MPQWRRARRHSRLMVVIRMAINTSAILSRFMPAFMKMPITNYCREASQTTDFAASEDTLAAYAMNTLSWDNTTLLLGLRLEHAQIMKAVRCVLIPIPHNLVTTSQR